jgi:hypothetical protein
VGEEGETTVIDIYKEKLVVKYEDRLSTDEYGQETISQVPIWEKVSEHVESVNRTTGAGAFGAHIGYMRVRNGFQALMWSVVIVIFNIFFDDSIEL